MDLSPSSSSQVLRSTSPSGTPSPLPRLTKPPSGPLFLAIDGGGTKTTAAISTLTDIISRSTALSSNYSDRGLLAATAAIEQAVRGAMEAIGLEWEERSGQIFESVWAGLAGVDSKEAVEAMKVSIAHLLRMDERGHDIVGSLENLSEAKGKEKERLIVTNDCDLLSSEISATSAEKGVVFVAGTGSIAIAFERSGLLDDDSSTGDMKYIGRAGGLGFLLGDEGSAFWTGREAIRRILSLADAKSYSTLAESTLVPLVLQHFGVKTVGELLEAVYTCTAGGDHARKIRIAEVCRLVQNSAFPSYRSSSLLPSHTSTPDPLALSILNLASSHLTSLLKTLCETHSIPPHESTLVLGTGLWSHLPFRRIVTEKFETKGGMRWKDVRIVGVMEGGPEGVACRELARRWMRDESRKINIT